MIKPRVSVIVTTHLRDDMLAECLASLAAQTVPVHEVVVVDDGGSGSARAVVERYGVTFNYVWQPNAGQQRARNNGVDQSTGNWIAFLDDDDLWLPNRHACILELAGTGQVDIIAGNFVMFSEGKIAISSFFDEIAVLQPGFWDAIPHVQESICSIVGSFPTTKLLPTSPFWGGTLVVQRVLFNKIGGWDESLRGIKSEDAEFAFRSIKNGHLGIIWLTTMKYRVHQNNSCKSNLLVAIGRQYIWEKIIKRQDTTDDEICTLSHHIKKSSHEILWLGFLNSEYLIVLKMAKKIGYFNLSFAEIIKVFISCMILFPKRIGNIR